MKLRRNLLYIQDDVRRAIAGEWLGEIPVGSAALFLTAHPRHPVLVYAPTMRVPEPCGEDSIAAYIAFRAVLCLAVRNGITHIAMPLLCTGAGEMPLETAARQMCEAYAAVARAQLAPAPLDLPAAHRHQRRLRGGRVPLSVFLIATRYGV